MLANAERSVGIDAPGKLDPKLVFFPDFAGIGLVSELHWLAQPFGDHAQDRLAEGDPASGMCFLTLNVVPLATHTHGQNIVGEQRGLAPHRRKRGVQADH